MGDPFNRQPFREGETALHDEYARLAALRNSAAALSTGYAVFLADSTDVLIVLRYITDGRDTFSLPAENGAYLCVLNRNREARLYSADCSAAGLGTVTGIAPPLSGTIQKLF